MGWAEGKGLGKDENGMLTHVKLKKRADELGIGSEVGDLRNKNFIEQQNSYTELLQALAKEHGSVENHKKSKKRKKEESSDESDDDEDKEGKKSIIKRKLPQKFQRGRVIHNKDVSKYSEADKAALFGIREKEISIEDVLPNVIIERDSYSVVKAIVVTKEDKEEDEEKEKKRLKKEKKREKKKLKETKDS